MRWCGGTYFWAGNAIFKPAWAISAYIQMPGMPTMLITAGETWETPLPTGRWWEGPGGVLTWLVLIIEGREQSDIVPQAAISAYIWMPALEMMPMAAGEAWETSPTTGTTVGSAPSGRGRCGRRR